jgi:hypothetical protein
LIFFVVSYSQCSVLTGHHCVLDITWTVISWYLSYNLSFQRNMGVLNLFLCVYNGTYIYIYICNYLFVNIVLINECFHNGPVIYPRLVIMAQGRLFWPEANREHITGPLWKQPFLNTFISQSISILGNLHSFLRRP